ncbi:MAG: hypothetical protein JO055_06020 [Alphaproteobacteria bacterium]|nr:hypothetical protein [Alphaproteobacteria bacterium]
MDDKTAAWILGAGLLVVIFGVIIYLAVMALVLIVPTWRICNRAGYSGAISLLHLIPGVGTLIVFAILAFGTWPAGEATPPGTQTGAR